MFALVLKLVLAVAVLVMPGGFLVLLAAAAWHRLRARQTLALAAPRRARIPAGVVAQNFSRACPSSLCYRP